MFDGDGPRSMGGEVSECAVDGEPGAPIGDRIAYRSSSLCRAEGTPG